MSPEVTGMVVRQEVALPRRDPVDIPVLADPHEVIAGLVHHIVSGASHALVIGSKSVPGGIADTAGLLPSGIVGSSASNAAPGRRTDRLGYPGT